MIAKEEWQPKGVPSLETNALKAATEIHSCLALTAGPGAGKTEMLAQRADFLLRTGTCRYPKRILAISFKVDASKNLKDRVYTRCGADLAARFDSYTFHGFAKRIIDRFRTVLTGKDALDAGYTLGDRKITRKQIEFQDLIPLAIQIIKTCSVARNAIRQTYSDVFLDEFQDCTDPQYELIKVAFQTTKTRLTAVGDTKQKIMGWAGALDGIFATFAVDFNAKSLNMYSNFRSKPRLLQMQNEIIRTLDPSSAMTDEQTSGNEGNIAIIHFINAQEEANDLAALIESWIHDECIPPSEIAVLVSALPSLYAQQLMNVLKTRGIPYRNEQQIQDITTEPIARLIVDYLSCLYGKREPKAWIRLLNQLTPFENNLDSVTKHDFHNFFKSQSKTIVLTERLGAPMDWWTPVKSFLEMLGTEVITGLSPDYESKHRLKELILETKKHIQELLNIECDLPKALTRFSDDMSVRILTIHKSKGLEFDSVIILAVENETFYGKTLDNRSSFFVGVSRAKRKLVLTYTDNRQKPDDYNKRWSINRTPHEEFLGYAQPFQNL